MMPRSRSKTQTKTAVAQGANPMTSVCRPTQPRSSASSCTGAVLLRSKSASSQPKGRFADQHRLLRSAAIASLFALSLVSGPATIAQSRPAAASDPASSATLTITGAVAQDLKLTLDDLKKLPRKSITTKGHDDQMHQYDGVPIGALLSKAGVPQGSALRGKSMALVVVAEGSDAYRAVFSVAEFDDDFAGEAVLVVDSMDGQPLGPDQGPLRLVVPADKRQARSVRMLKSLTIVNLSGSTPSN
jgi:DMSO/TMAO reductase YedYZ molybdopterin-dependent catalytic subunit